MAIFEVRVNGRVYAFWEEATYTRSLDDLCGTFSFTTSDKHPPDTYPVNKGDALQVFINRTALLTGFVDTINIRGSEAGTFVNVSGRDKTQDIVDSSVPPDAKNIEGPISFVSLCETVISGLGANIQVIDQTGGVPDFTATDLQAGATAENAFYFLESFARKRQIYLNTNGNGDLVLFRPGRVTSSTVLRNEIGGERNNVKAWESQNTDTARFNQYVVRSQDNIGFDEAMEYFGEGNSRSGTATDSAIRSSRYFEIIAEESMNDSDSSNRAAEESNLRRTRSFSYLAAIAEIVQDNGELWDVGITVPVVDQKCDVNGQFLIRTLRMSQNVEGGTETILTVSEPDAYNLNAQLSARDARRAQVNRGFV